MGNAAFNPVSTLTRADLVAMIDTPGIAALVARIMDEVRTAGESLAATITVPTADRIAQARRMGPIRSSMLQDFDRHRPLETLPLLDSVIHLAGMTGIAVPNLTTVAALVTLLDRTNQPG